MEVKIFYTNCIGEDLQKRINQWMKKEKPSVKFIQQSESVVEGSYNLTISIWYEEPK